MSDSDLITATVIRQKKAGWLFSLAELAAEWSFCQVPVIPVPVQHMVISLENSCIEKIWCVLLRQESSGESGKDSQFDVHVWQFSAPC